MVGDFATPVRSYTCYRTYLRDFVELKRRQNRRFTVRRLCLMAGLKTENYVLRIIRGERNMTPKLAANFVPVLGLQRDDASYFMSLVNVEAARTDEERIRSIREAERLRCGVRPAITDNSILRHWYLGAIWELAGCKNADTAPAAVARALGGKITVAQAANAVDFLKSKGFLITDGAKLRQGNRPICSTDGSPDPVIRLNHKQMLRAAEEAVDLPLEKRVFMGLTIAINAERVQEIRNHIREFVLNLRQELEMDGEANAVYRVGVHSFPIATADVDEADAGDEEF